MSEAGSGTPVVSCFLRHRGEVLLLKRSGEVGSYRGRWGPVAGHVEENDPDGSAIREIAEETGLDKSVRLARRGEPFAFEDEELERRWIVHPYLFDCDSREARLDWESVEGEWVSPAEILRRETVPRLWSSYLRVAPAPSMISEDRAHGSAYLSLRALEVLRDRAAVLRDRRTEPGAAWKELRDLAQALVSSRPSMVVLANRIDRVMAEAARDRSPARVEESAHLGIARAVAADEGSSRRAEALVRGRRVLTLSRSDTVTAALSRARPSPKVVIAESRPGLEGVGLAEELARSGREAILVTDAAMAEAMEHFEVELVMAGADALLPSGAVVNKTGTRLAALAARDRGIPTYAVAASDKISAREDLVLELSDPRELYRGDGDFGTRNALFEITPGRLVTGIVTEHGTIAPGEVALRVGELQELARWRE